MFNQNKKVHFLKSLELSFSMIELITEQKYLRWFAPIG